MKHRLLLTLFIFTFVIGSLARAQDLTPFAKELSSMNRAFRQLKKQVVNPAQNSSSLVLVAQIKQSVAALLKLPPSKADDLSDGARAAFLADYQTKMRALAAITAKIESALKANDNPEAVKLVEEFKQISRED